MAEVAATPPSSATRLGLAMGTNVWVTGYYIQNVRPFARLTLVYHWDGTAWHRVPSPNPSSENLMGGVAVTPAAGVWAVGFYLLGSQQQTMRTFAFHCC